MTLADGAAFSKVVDIVADFEKIMLGMAMCLSCSATSCVVGQNRSNKSEYFLIRNFWIGRDPPLLTESKKKSFF